MYIQVIKSAVLKDKPESEQNLGFGKRFTDHMFVAEYTAEKGWHNARIQPYAPFSIDPASPVLHYGQEIFEGLKAYRRADGEILLFRAIENARRMNRSADRMVMPAMDPAMQVEAMERLVDIERDWVPCSEGTSLYLRPTMIADGAALGVHAAPHYYYFIICSPSGAYYANGMKPIRIYIEDTYVRAVKGGMGFAKTGGNYACSLKAAEEANAQGYDQVLWLDGKHNTYVQEVGAMNMMFVIDGKLVTPELDGSILPGITRNSILTMARDRGMEVVETLLSVDELVRAYDEGRLTEAFGTGTAAVVSPVGEITYKGKQMILNGGEIGPVSMSLYEELVGIQRGISEDKRGWSTVVPHF